MLKVILIFFGAMSLLTFFLYGIDKLKAKLNAWRIPEKVLLRFSLLGGGFGGALAMLLFRHKTNHWSFVFGNVLGVIIQIGAIVALELL